MADRQKTFDEALHRMNPEQREAVEKTEGPVMVIAGPGTGKTQILAARIGYILSRKDLQTFPENILCMTYTEAGTVAMRQRLLDFIGPDAYRISISTFHGFCNQLIRQYPEYFGHDSWQMITEIEEVQLIREIIDGLPGEHPLKKYTGDAYSDAGRLLQLFRQMKKEDWTAEQIGQKVEEYLKEIQTHPENYPSFFYQRNSGNNQKGDLKEKEFGTEKERLERTLAAARLSNEYQRLLEERKLYDFDDMIMWVLREMKENEDFRMSLQEKYTYILVDEFQDTNESQNELVNLLCSHWGPDSNVFVVGDDDQSIFRFQGANMQNILTFTQRYQERLQTVLLRENYRSTQTILDAAAQLISVNQERFVGTIPGMNKKLHAAGKAGREPVFITELPNQADEIIYIGNRIKNAVQSGLKPSEIAVIYRNNKQADELSRYLRYAGIPFTLRRRTNILEETFTRKVLMLLEYITGEQHHPFSKDDLLFRVLQFDFWEQEEEFSPARLLLECHKDHPGSKDHKGLFRRYIQDKLLKRKPDLFSQGESGMIRTARILEDLIREAAWLSPSELLEKVIYGSGLVRSVLKSEEKIFELEQLRTLFDHIAQAAALPRRPSLADILEDLKLMRQYKISLEIERVIHQGEGVLLTTAHSSKGLEFEHVYMMGNTRKEWDGAPNRGFKLPPNLFFRVAQADETEEQRRLFYVAMTRAKSHLEISYYRESLTGKSEEPCRFISELPDDAGLVKKQKIYIPTQQAEEFHAAVMQTPQPTTLPETDHPMVDKFVSDLKISATQMSSYLECPRQFYYNYVLKVPVAKQRALIFGDAVHKAYEYLFKKLPEHHNEFPPVEYMISVFRARMYQDESAIAPADFKRYMEHGERIITNHYNYYSKSWNKVMTVERRMRAVVYGGIPITGFIDKIEFDGRKAMVIDYKTGKPSNAADKFKTPVKVADPAQAKKHELYGGDYWRQAVFYKILLEHDQEKGNQWQFSGAAFDFIEPDEKSGDYIKRDVYITEEDENFVAGLIQQVYEKIKNKDFHTGCGTCEWCMMLK